MVKTFAVSRSKHLHVRMRRLLKRRTFVSTSQENFKTQTSKIKIFEASFHSRPSKLPMKILDTQTRKSELETNELASIFTMITDIIGTDTQSASTSDAHSNILKINEPEPRCTSIVCGNVNKSIKVKESVVNDVSPIVRKIAEVVRVENASIQMEERLEKEGFVFDSNIVEKVMRRCFKVGSLALRFFNWLKCEKGFRHTTETYNTMIYIAGEAKEFNLVDELVEQMERECCSKDIKTWTILIASYGKAKLIGKSLTLFERMRRSGSEPDGTVYRVIVSALCNTGKADIAMEFYKEMVSKKIEVNMDLYKLLLSCLSRSGNISEVRLIGDDMINVAQIPEQEVYSCILRSFCIARRIRESLELLHELKNKRIMLDSANFGILVKGLCRDGQISDALEIVEIMKQSNVIDGETYGIIVNGYLRRNEVSKAFEVLNSMKESGHAPTAFTYTELMQYLFRFNKYDRACKLYDEMLEKGVQPDIVTMTALVAGHIQNNHMCEAWKVFEIMNEKGIKMTHKSYSIVVKELCKASKTDEALKVLNKMRDSKMKIGDKIFQYITFALEKKGDVQKAGKIRQTWREFSLVGQQKEPVISNQSLCGGIETTFEGIANHQLNCNHEQQTEVNSQQPQPLQELYSDHDLQETCRILSCPIPWSAMQEALEKCNILFSPELVLEVLRRCQLYGHAALSFFSWVGRQANYSHTTETYNMGIKTAGSSKDFRHMRNIYLEMKRRGCVITSDTWTIMIMQYGRAGLTEIALRKFEEMKLDGYKPNRSTYKYLIVLLCGKKGRRVDEAILAFRQMINAGYVPDKELAEVYLDCLCEVGKISDARQCMQSLCKAGLTVPLSYSLLIRSLCRTGRIEEALGLTVEAGDHKSTLDQYIFGSLVHALLRAGRVEEALEKVETMKKRGINPTVHVYTSLLVHFFKEKQIEKALGIFKKMREEGCEPTIVTYSALVRGYMDMGMVSDARNIFRRMKLKGPYPDFKAYSMFITSLCEIGMSEEALHLISEMLDSGIFPSTVNFRTIYYGLNREGKQDIAHTVLQKKWALVSGRKFNQSKSLSTLP